MTMHRVAITPNSPRLGSHKIEVDGNDISNAVARATLWMNPEEVPELDLEIRVIDIQQLGGEDVQVCIPDETADALVKLGWTPPESGS